MRLRGAGKFFLKWSFIMVDVKGNLARVRERIAAAAKRAGVDAGGITLVAVSKTKPASMVREAIGAGASVFGENYVQEGVVKAEEFQDLAEWHFIGHLQRNKVRLVAERFDMVESVDSLALASRLDAACGAIGRRLDVLMQIHYGLEESKHGFYPEEAGEAFDRISELPNLKLRGLMTIPPLVGDPEENRRYFADMRELGIRLFEDPVLSMGMTSDLEIAIEEGSNMVRIGTAIFGERDYSKRTL